MWVMGVDENGLGPRLGPLIATGVVLEFSRYDRSGWMRKARALGIDDSKQAGGFGKMALCESIALAVLEKVQQSAPRPSLRTVDDVLCTATASSLAFLQRQCPSSTLSQCWSHNAPLPVFGGDLDEGHDRLQRLIGRSRLRFHWVRSKIACAGALNGLAAQGDNKLVTDLHLFEDLILSARKGCDDDLFVVCGMVGGIRDYPGYFREIKHADAMVHRRGQRRYRVDGVGEVRFEVHADARHLPVALASIVGKYLRELSMHRISAFYREHHSALPRVSGYHDPVTARFIADTQDLRTGLGVSSDCFERKA